MTEKDEKNLQPNKRCNNDPPLIRDKEHNLRVTHIVNEDNTHTPMFGIKGSCKLHKLHYFDIYFQVPVDPMHCISGVIKQRVQLMKGERGSSKAIRESEKLLGRFPHMWIIDVNNVLPIKIH